MIEAVLPISDREPVRRNLERFELLLKSFNFFWIGDKPLIINVITPDEELTRLVTFTDNLPTMLNIRINHLSESDVHPSIGLIRPGLGTAKQMLIKLAAFRFVASPFFLTLDSDIVACQPFAENDLIRGGRAIAEWVCPTLHEWWHESSKTLQKPLEHGALDKPRIHVTPLVLSADICRLLAKHLSAIYAVDWVEALFAKYSGNHPYIWTEYTLYDLFAEASGLYPRYHWPSAMQEAFPRWRLHNSQSVWSADQFENWCPEKALLGISPGLFSIIQSITAHDLEFEKARDKWNMALKSVYPYYNI